MGSERQRGILFSSQISVGCSAHALGVCALALPTIGAITPKCRLVPSHPQRQASTPAPVCRQSELLTNLLRRSCINLTAAPLAGTPPPLPTCDSVTDFRRPQDSVLFLSCTLFPLPRKTCFPLSSE